MYNPEQISRIKHWLGSGSINLFGRPFAGKDVQCARLAEMFGGNMVGGGEILRGGDMPNHIKSLMRTGKLIPTSDYINIVLPYLNQDRLAKKPLILSSLGRWHGEEPGVTGAVAQSGHPLRAVIYLDISNDESRTRWTKRDINNDRTNRHDDTEEILEIRFKEFAEKTLPVVKHYRDMGILVKIDGKLTRDQVTQEILDALDSFANR